VPENKRHLTPRCGRCGVYLRETTGKVVEVGDHNFDVVVNSTAQPVLVDFYSKTCGPCRALAPVIEGLAARYAGRALICAFDTGKHQMVAARFQIRGVPTLIFFKNGRVVDQVVGMVAEQELARRLEALL